MRSRGLVFVFIVAALSVGTTRAQAASLSTQCICITGSQPFLWVPFFNAGCALWLAENTCVRGTIQSMSRPIRLDSFKAQELRIGVVAERTFSSEFYEFLEQRISPLLPLGQRGHFQTLRIDDTACNGMRNPEAVALWMTNAQTIFKGKIEIQANQTVSVGMWRPFFPGKPNFVATMSSEKSYLLPLCSEYQGHRCYGEAQGDMSAECRVAPDAQILNLRCLPVQTDHYYSDELGSPQVWSEHTYQWIPEP